MVLTALAEGLDASAAERVFGYRQATITAWLTRAGRHAESLHERCFLGCSWLPAHKRWHTCSSTPYDRAWPPFCLPVFTSDGLNLYFYAAFGSFWTTFLQVGRRGRNVLRWQVAAGLIYGQVKKCYRRRKLVQVTPVMRLGTEAALQAALEGLGLSGRLNTAFIERVNLTVRNARGSARKTYLGHSAAVSTPGSSPGVVASLLSWMSRPHQWLRVRLVQPRERGGKRLAQRYRQRTPAMAVGRTHRQWTACELLSCPLPPVSA
jgi:hypothetical protein